MTISNKDFCQIKLLKAGLFLDAAQEALADGNCVKDIPEAQSRVLCELQTTLETATEILSSVVLIIAENAPDKGA